MLIFVYEYTCSSVRFAPLPSSFLAEGRAMLTAVVEDLARANGVAVAVMLNEHGDGFLPAQIVRCLRDENEEAAFRKLAKAADYTLVIAPEFDELLLTRCRWVEEAGGHLLGPSASAVCLSGDKLRLGEHLAAHGIPTPEALGLGPWALGSVRAKATFTHQHPLLNGPVVLKPRFGAGSQMTFLVNDMTCLPSAVKQAQAEAWPGELLLQQFVPGQAVSASLLVGQGQTVALLAGEQHLSTDGRFRYLGGSLPLSPALSERAFTLALRAVQTVPDLRGYVGVDMILGSAKDGSQDWVIEINPRLTTSYVGLRALALTNLAEAMVKIVAGEKIPEPKWRQTRVIFLPDGTVHGERAANYDKRWALDR